MDILRARPRGNARSIWIGGAVLGAIGMVLLVPRVRSAVALDASSLIVDTVRRGTLIREVSAAGILVPERVRIVAAVTAGRVEQLPVATGTMLRAGDVIAELSNPDVALEGLEAERGLSAAESALLAQESNAEGQYLAQEATLATVRADLSQARRTLSVAETLASKNLSSASELTAARERVQELEVRERSERRRLVLLDSSARNQARLQRGQIQRLAAIVRFHNERARAMRIVATEAGVLQQLPLELGQWVNPGMVLARIAHPGRLKAVLKVPEGQARDVVTGLRATIDTHNGLVPGRVSRVDPAVVDRTVAVEVELEGQLPAGLRPDISVEGTIQIERTPNVILIDRPASAPTEGSAVLYRLSADGRTATRVPVVLGKSSNTAVIVRVGLNPGERVIVSDMSGVSARTVRVR